MIVFILSGELVAHTPDGRLEVGAGQAWFVRSLLDYTLEWPVKTLMVSLTVPSDALEEFGIAPSVQIDVLEASPLLHDAAQRFIESVAGSKASGTGPAPYIVERLLLEMAGALLLSDDGLRAARRTGLEDIRYQAERLIGVKYVDSLYDTAALAADLNVSLRQLQRSFAASGSTPAAVLAKMRLEQAQRLLQDPACRMLDMAEIAQHSGYRSARQLREHFRRAGLGAPRANRSHSPARPGITTARGTATPRGYRQESADPLRPASRLLDAYAAEAGRAAKGMARRGS
ncbi:hypothetical protein GCM10023081_08750 [Arthrobacter ginkgonis]|uniref:HTH araC/xylS-type domain-containing protein n=1 Tax=Arthrobacter ginkgonis TaxID=1630594 RepID=A0ABP7C0V1_9MICC